MKTLDVEKEAKAAPFTVTDESLTASALAGREDDGRMTTRRRANLRATAASLRSGKKVGTVPAVRTSERRNNSVME